jgi:integral membrane sensor domain MASE1
MPRSFLSALRANPILHPDAGEAETNARFLRNLVAVTVVAALYLLAGKLGLKLAFANASATAVWPPTGIALAAFLLIGYRAWPGVLLAAFLTNITTAGGVGVSLSIAIGNTLEGLVGAYLIRRFAGGLYALERLRGVLKFMFFGALVSTLVSATCGTMTLALAHLARWSDYGTVWLTWWLGDATGDLIVAPLLILWFTRDTDASSKKNPVEACALVLLLVAVAEIVFGGLFPSSFKNYPLEFLCIPILIWVALRFRQRDVVAALLLLSAIAIRGTLAGFGPFVARTQNESLLLLQSFMGVTAVMTMTVAAVVSEHRRTQLQREALIQELEQAFNNVKTLKGLLPICAACKKIRDEQGRWGDLESYVRKHSDADFTHGICPSCAQALYPEEWKSAS